MLPWAPERKPSAPLSRQARKKSKTRDDLVAAAIELFATQGYANTTIEQITEAADVSARTFFRHFRSKEDVLFPAELEPDPLMDSVSRQPATSNDLEAIRDACLEVLPGNDLAVRPVLQLKKAIRSTPALEGRDLALQREYRGLLALAVARRHGLESPDETAEMVSALAQAVIRLAFDRWADSNGRADLAALLCRHFDLAERIVKEPLSSSRKRRVVTRQPRISG
jgi:AcrR family transcriptional regulator